MSNGKKKPTKKPAAGAGATRASRPQSASDAAEVAAPAAAAETAKTTAKDRSPEAKKAAVKSTGTTREDRRAALRAQQLKQQQIARRNKQLKYGALALALVVLVAGLGWLAWKFTRPKDRVTPQHATADKAAISVFGGNAKPGARTVGVYQDYQCPACKEFDTAYGETLVSMAKAGDIKLEMHTMTFLDSNLHNDSSKRAANAAACVDATGSHYWDYFQAVYAGQANKEGTGFTDSQLRNDFASQAGITGKELTDFQKCFDSSSAQAFVSNADTANERALAPLYPKGAFSTPSVTVDGKLMDLSNLMSEKGLASPSADAVKAAIDATK